MLIVCFIFPTKKKLTGEATDDQPFVPNNEKPTEYDPNLYLYSVSVRIFKINVGSPKMECLSM